jgi:hypothetical protein
LSSHASGQRTATLDIDAVVIETHKQEALYCYAEDEGIPATEHYWAEHGLVVHSEFRDGNVPAGYQIRRVLDEFLAHLPAGVEEVSVRSDSAAYEIDLLRYLHSGGNGRLKEGDRAKPILFTIGVPITKEYKEASGQPSVTWEPVYREHADGRREKTGQEWAEVGFVPNSLAHSKNDPEFRFIAVREPLEQPTLPGMEGQAEAAVRDGSVRGPDLQTAWIVTNRDWDGNRGSGTTTALREARKRTL